jgi:hypothetical protein
MGITYIHRRELAPTPEIRRLQNKADEAEKVAKRERSGLNLNFMDAYRDEVLAGFDSEAFLDELPGGSRVVALFCVERKPEACHRSLVAERLLWVDGVEVEHLLPPN